MAQGWGQEIAGTEAACSTGSSGKHSEEKSRFHTEMYTAVIFWQWVTACIQILISSLSSECLTHFLSSETFRYKWSQIKNSFDRPQLTAISTESNTTTRTAAIKEHVTHRRICWFEVLTGKEELSTVKHRIKTSSFIAGVVVILCRAKDKQGFSSAANLTHRLKNNMNKVKVSLWVK